MKHLSVLLLLILGHFALADHHEGTHHEEGHPEAAHPEGAHPEGAHPGDHHEEAHPETAHAKDAHPEGDHHEHDHPEGDHHEHAHPEGDHHEHAQPEGDHHEHAQPEAVHHEDDHPVIETTSGSVEGKLLTTHNAHSVEAFLGIPYAEPPTGDLRFKPPVPIHKAEGTISAKEFGHSCPQIDFSKLNPNVHKFPTISDENEDCLVLNVLTPHPRPINASVLFYIHGAPAFAVGSSCLEKYDSRHLVEEQNIIVVTFNFRLSELGFLFFDHPESPGNVGIMDQQLALKWVNDNIEHFGGDPHKITLMGEMAGSASVGMHMLIPSSKGLFEQAIMLDGTPNSYKQVNHQKEGLKSAHLLAEAVGCSSDTKDVPKIVACLRQKTIEELTEATLKSVIARKQVFGLVYDGHLIPHHPKVLLLQGKMDHDIKVMLGTSHNRGMMATIWILGLKPEEGQFLEQPQMEKLIRTIFKDSTDFAQKIILSHYTNNKHPDCPKAIRQEAIDLATDVFTVCPTNLLADELALNGNDVYLFQFTHHSSKAKYPAWAGVLVGEEVDYIMGNVHTSHNYTEEEHKLSHSIMSHIGRFIRTGVPTEHGKEANFPRYNLRHKPYANVRLGGAVEHHLRADHCAFWQKAYPRVKLAGEILKKHQCE